MLARERHSIAALNVREIVSCSWPMAMSFYMTLALSPPFLLLRGMTESPPLLVH